MRNDNKSWKKGPQRAGKQFGGPLDPARPLGGVGGVGGVGAPVRPLGFKGGARVKKVHGGVLARPAVRPLGLKHGSKAKKS